MRMNSGTIVVDPDSGVELAYLDTGPPQSKDAYETVFTVHGYGFSNAVFKNLFPLCSTNNLRIVSISRRGYSGSTPYTPAEVALFTSSDTHITDKEKQSFVRARGMELLRFMDEFILSHAISPVSSGDNGRRGGVVLLGWSLGAAITLSAIANLPEMQAKLKTRMREYLRDHIMLEPSTIASVGVPTSAKSWSPFIDPTIPISDRAGLAMHLLSAYYDHDIDVSNPVVTHSLSHIVPSTRRIPTLYNMTLAEQKGEVFVLSNPKCATGLDLAFLRVCAEQNAQTYRKACFDSEVRGRRKTSEDRNVEGPFDGMRVWEVVGERSHATLWMAFFAIQEDDRQAGGDFVTFKVVEGANHFMHWDDPQKIISLLREILDLDS